MKTVISIFSLLMAVPLWAAPPEKKPMQADAQQASPVVPLSVDLAIQTALKGSPGLGEIHARAEALALIPAQKATLPDPHLSFKVLNLPVDSYAVGQEGMTQLQFGLSQMLPFPGKLSLLSELASDQARMAEFDVGEWRLRLVRDVRSLWWRLVYLDRALEIVTSNQALLRQFVTIAQTKYRVGRGLQQDVLLAQLELSKLLDRELVLQNRRQTHAARLNTLMGVDVVRRVLLPLKIDQKLPGISPEAELLKRARQNRPVLKRQDAAIEVAQSRIDLAHKDYYPDVMMTAAYGLRSGANPNGSGRDDFLSLGANINLPIFTGTRQDKQLDQRQRELLESRFKKQDIRNRVDTEVTVAYADYVRARQQTRLFMQGIIPQATQTVASMRAGYEVNKVDFLNLIRAQITLFNYQTRYWQALSQAHEAMARLMAATGKETLK